MVAKDKNNLIEQQNAFENAFLSNYATKSAETRGRIKPEEVCYIRNEFQRDRDRILHSKAFRRLKHKTQVFISPLGDHYRTRMTHTLEVSQISRTIARALRLNEDLTEAIALGHDLGHTPFGHTGETVLNGLMSEGFRHNEQSVRVVSIIEDKNLTQETLDGMLNHTGPDKPYTLEGQIVRIADRIAYLNHDIDDSIRAGIMSLKDLPTSCNEYFGITRSSRIKIMVTDLITNSIERPEIQMSVECKKNMDELRAWMFEHVYIDSEAKSEEKKARKVIVDLYDYYINMLTSLNYIDSNNTEMLEKTVADYIASMTDRYAKQIFIEKFIPTPLNVPTDDGFLFKLAEKNNLYSE